MTRPVRPGAHPPIKFNNEQILAFIRSYYQQHGEGPCIRELMEGIGIKSYSVVYFRIEELETDELITTRRSARFKKKIIELIPLAQQGRGRAA